MKKPNIYNSEEEWNNYYNERERSYLDSINAKKSKNMPIKFEYPIEERQSELPIIDLFFMSGKYR